MRIREDNTKDGYRIDLKYIEKMDELKPGIHCDGIKAFVDGDQVGYIKFDYTTPKIMADELHTLWMYGSEYGGSYIPDKLQKPYSEFSAADFAYLIKSILDNDYNAARVTLTDTQKSLVRSITDYKSTYEPRDSDRKELFSIIRACEKSPFGKRIAAQRKQTIAHFVKPFVSYVNTRESGSGSRNGEQSDNSRRGIGSVLYRAAALWIADRGLAGGIYASGNQSPHAQAIWEVFDRLGWVTQDGKRKFLDANKVTPLT